MERIVGWMEKRCELTPNRVAVVDGETSERWTFAELSDRINNMAAYLAQQGVTRGDRVALLSPNHISYLDLLFACGRIGAIFVPLNWRLAASELNYILRDCMPVMIISHPSLQALSSQLRAVDEAGAARVESDSTDYDLIMKNGNRARINQVEAESTDPLAIIYTGGTTGRPKGVVLSHMSIYSNSVNTIISWKFSGDEVTPTYLPMFHTGGLNALSIPVLMMGGTVVIARSFDKTSVIDLLNREKCTIALMVPTMYHMLTESAEFAAAEFPTMHTFVSGGAPCPKSVYKAFAKKGLAFKEGYGATESGPNNFFIDPQDALRKPNSVGKPMMLNDVKIVKDSGEEAAANEVGEVLLRGGHLFQSYWNQPEATEQAMRDGWFHTGDLGKRDEDGDFYIVGRKKDMIITGGENVYPLEVEHLIASHPVVRDVAVVGLPDDKWGEVVTAIVVLHPGCKLTAAELQSYCSAAIGKYKVPKKVVFVDELPVTPVGKLDKNALILAYR